MRRRSQAILTHALLVLYAGTMLLGQGLHRLACCGHSDEQGHLVDSASEHVECPAATAEHALSPNDAGVSAKDAHNEHPADCLICKFYSLGQVVPPAVGLCVRPLAVAEMDSASEWFSPFDRTVVYSPRAPPSA